MLSISDEKQQGKLTYPVDNMLGKDRCASKLIYSSGAVRYRFVATMDIRVPNDSQRRECTTSLSYHDGWSSPLDSQCGDCATSLRYHYG